MIDKARMLSNTKRLVSAKSISGTELERSGAERIMELLDELDYFKQHKENVYKQPIAGDPFGRCIIAALLEGGKKSKNTIILTGHYDVVDVDGYAQLKDIAFDVDEITKRINELPLDEDAKRDADTGEWIFGRGTADMKFGHALIIELLRHYSESENLTGLNGNLLYVAVCGEETNSEGMLAASAFLNGLAEKRKLHYSALLLAECYLNENMANDPRRYIHYGATGKVMPMFLCAGKGCHADEPFAGLDANSLNAAVYELLAMNTDYCQSKNGECTPPAVCLKMKDLKATYSASIPMYAVSYYSILTLKLEPDALISSLRMIAMRAFELALEKRSRDAEAYGKLMNKPMTVRSFAPCVMTYEELYNEVKKQYNGDLDAHLKAFAGKLTEKKLELQDISIELVRHVYELYGAKQPMIILSFIPPYYPDVYMDPADADAGRLLAAAKDVIDYARRQFNEHLELKDYYMGLSDLSYTGLGEDAGFDTLFKNLAGAGLTYDFPLQALKQLHVPGIVLGGWGKDFHQNSERQNIPYSFDVLPKLYMRIIADILG